MNRSVLLIPVLCGGRNDIVIDQVLNKASQIDLDKWEKESIPYTIRKKTTGFPKNRIQISRKKITE